MFDVQAVYIRDIAQVRGVRFISMLRVEAAPPASNITSSSDITNATVTTVTKVTINGYSAKFMLRGLTTLLVALPSSLEPIGRNSDGGRLPVEAITNITVYRATTDSDGNSIEIPEVLSDLGGSGGGIDQKAPVGSRRVTVDGGVLNINGDDFDKTVAVRVNRQNQEFTIMSPSTLLCTFPEKAISIDDVEVITTSNRINRSSAFAYLFTENVGVVSGEFKLVQQFVKILLTTVGSDIFEQNLGGNLQKWVGQNSPMNNPQALVAKTVLNIVGVAAKFAARQSGANVPAEERLSDVTVLNVGFDRSTPDVMDLTLRLNTFARRQATVSLLIGSAAEGIAQAKELTPVL